MTIRFCDAWYLMIVSMLPAGHSICFRYDPTTIIVIRHRNWLFLARKIISDKCISNINITGQSKL